MAYAKDPSPGVHTPWSGSAKSPETGHKLNMCVFPMGGRFAAFRFPERIHYLTQVTNRLRVKQGSPSLAAGTASMEHKGVSGPLQGKRGKLLETLMDEIITPQRCRLPEENDKWYREGCDILPMLIPPSLLLICFFIQEQPLKLPELSEDSPETEGR